MDDRLDVVVDVGHVHVSHVEQVDDWLEVMDVVGSSQVAKVDDVDEVVGKVKNLDVVGLVDDVVDEVDAVAEENHVVD